MQKLTDSEYRLPLIEAMGSFELMDTGTTQPMAIRGVDTVTGKRGQFVVKFRNATRMSIKSSCYELLGAWMAREIDIKAVEPVLVNISEKFVSTLRGQYGYNAAYKSIGFNFGSVYEAGYQIIPNTKFSIDGLLVEQAKRIFMFDMFISNADRGAGKPNVLSNGDEFLVFDHELGFSFINMLPFLRNKTPWILSHLEKEMYNQHFFFPLLKGNDYDFSQHIGLLERFNDNFWNKAMQWIPSDWQTEELVEIREYLDSIITNRNIFADQLTKILAS
jgi:hypothetical protein